MLRKQINVKNNSFHFNESSDEKLYCNYEALARCITGIQIKDEIIYPTIAQSCSVYGLYKDDEKVRITSGTMKTPGTYSDKELIAVDIITEEVIEYKNGKELSEKLGLKTGNINGAIKKQSLYAGRYLINFKGYDAQEMIEHYRKTKGLKVKYKLINTETNEEKEFDRTKDAGKYIGVSGSGILYGLRNGSKIKGIWIVTRTREEYNG